VDLAVHTCSPSTVETSVDVVIVDMAPSALIDWLIV
jgi:hypothetical protein